MIQNSLAFKMSEPELQTFQWEIFETSYLVDILLNNINDVVLFI